MSSRQDEDWPVSYFRVRRDGVGLYARRFESADAAKEFVQALGIHDPVEILWFNAHGKVIDGRSYAMEAQP